MLKNGKFYIGVCRIRLSLTGNRSLKGKRAILSRVKSRVKNRFNVAISEVADNDSLQTASLAVSSVSNDGAYLEGQLRKLVDFISGISDAEVEDFSLSVEIKGGYDHLLV
jgi:hypothetical protein